MTRAITTLFAPMKIHTAVMGNLCPHVHCHVIPRYADDDPHHPFDPNLATVHLDSQRWDERLRAMRSAVEAGLAVSDQP